MAYQYVFRRKEIKYILSREQQANMREAICAHMRPDEHGQSIICNVYFDTPSFMLIRRSLEHPLYKEKLRIRTYGVATPTSPTFIEIKKKYQGIVYKRRVCVSEQQAMAYLCDGVPPEDNQITREIDYFIHRYRGLAPAMFIAYEREAFFGQEDRDFRITFDDDITWRTNDLSLCAGLGGTALLPKDRVLMEIKAGGAFPLWVAEALSAYDIFPHTFTKYGFSYLQMMEQEVEQDRALMMQEAG